MKYEDDMITTAAFCRNPLFLIRLVLAIITLLLMFAASATFKWPAFCGGKSWAFFNNIGTLASLFITEIATLITWYVFENANWVFYFVVYTSHFFLLVMSGVIFFLYSPDHCFDNNKILQGLIYEIVFEILIIFIGGVYFVISIIYLMRRHKIVT